MSSVNEINLWILDKNTKNLRTFHNAEFVRVEGRPARAHSHRWVGGENVLWEHAPHQQAQTSTPGLADCQLYWHAGRPGQKDSWAGHQLHLVWLSLAGPRAAPTARPGAPTGRPGAPTGRLGAATARPGAPTVRLGARPGARPGALTVRPGAAARPAPWEEAGTPAHLDPAFGGVQITVLAVWHNFYWWLHQRQELLTPDSFILGQFFHLLLRHLFLFLCFHCRLQAFFTLCRASSSVSAIIDQHNYSPWLASRGKLQWLRCDSSVDIFVLILTGTQGHFGNALLVMNNANYYSCQYTRNCLLFWL